MKMTVIEKLQETKTDKRIAKLVVEIRARMDNGHYNFMTWTGRTQLGEKLNEYERYVNETHRTGSLEGKRAEKKKLSDMEVELRKLLGSTY